MPPTLSLDLLLRLTALFSAAVLLLALLRPLLMRTLGAQATYLSWLLVPLLMASPWLPLPRLAADMPQLPAVAAVAAQVVTVTQALPAAVATPAAAAPTPSPWLLAWLAGTALLAVAQVALQRRYMTGLRRDADGRWQAPAGASPAVVGLWPQRLVLPQDFAQRFDGTAQRLVLAHEAVHARRHDNAWNLLAVALLCLQWFNPLAWWAWGRLRNDQELACDAAVLTAEASPAPLAAYAEAMLAAHRAPWQPALASGWATRHPLVERVRMLSRHRSAPRWRHAGAVALVLGVGGGAALLAQAAQSPETAATIKGSMSQPILFEIASQVGNGAWTHNKAALPGLSPNPMNTPRQQIANVMVPGMCLSMNLYEFADGDVRPTVQVMDETCNRALGEPRQITADGRIAQFTAVTAQGSAQAQLSARFLAPDDPALLALKSSRADAPVGLSPSQQAVLERRRAHALDDGKMLATQDRAWREAREAAAH